MPDLAIVEAAQRSPGCCVVCNTTDGPFVDTLRDVLPFGRFYLCVGSEDSPGCALQIARALGCAFAGEAEGLVQELEAAAREIDQLRARTAPGTEPVDTLTLIDGLDLLEKRLAARIAGEDPDELRAIADLLVDVSVPTGAAWTPGEPGRGTILLEDAPPAPVAAVPAPEGPEPEGDEEPAPERAPDPRRARQRTVSEAIVGAAEGPSAPPPGPDASMAQLDDHYTDRSARVPAELARTRVVGVDPDEAKPVASSRRRR